MAETTQDRVQEWVRAYMEAWNAHDPDAVIGLMTDDVVFDDLALGERFEGAAGIREFMSWAESSFSTDYRFEPGAFATTAADGYAFEWLMSGTNDRADARHGLPATGKPFAVPGVSIGRLRDGRIAENHDYWNLAGYLMQVGLMPVAEPAAPVG